MKYLLVLLGLAFSSQHAYSQKIVGCYWTAGTGQTDFNNMCTHSYFKIYTLQSDGTVTNSYPLNLPDLKQKNKGVKMIASIGGMMSSYSFPTVASDPAKVSSFVQNCVNLAVNEGYDGIDIDWHNQQESDRTNIVNMLKELKSALNARGKMLTVAITDINFANSATYSADVCGSVDLLNVQASAIQIGEYDYEGERPTVLTLNSPYQVYDDTTNKVIASGCPLDKLVLGAPLKGHKFSIDPQSDKLPGSPGMIMNAIKYGQTCYEVKSPDAEIKRLNDVPYAILNSNSWLTYEDPESIAAKANYAVEKGLAGMFFYDTFSDDYGFDCQKTGNYPLIKAAYNVLVPPSSKGIVGCYWFSGSTMTNFTNLCTHAFFKSFEAKPDVGNIVAVNGKYPNFYELRQTNPRVKMIGSVHSSSFASIAADPVKLDTFVRECVSLAVGLVLDGMDIAWHNMQESNRPAFVNMLKALKAALSAQGKILTTVIIDSKFASSGPYKDEVCNTVDMLNVEITAIPPSGRPNVLTLNAPSSFIESGITMITGTGCPTEKLVLGINPLVYNFQVYPEYTMEPGSSAKPLGFSLYGRYCIYVRNPTAITNRREQVPYIKYSPQTGVTLWMTYEDAESVASKVVMAKERKLSGVFFFLADYDDNEGICDYPFLKFPLLSSAYKAFHG